MHMETVHAEKTLLINCSPRFTFTTPVFKNWKKTVISVLNNLASVLMHADS